MTHDYNTVHINLMRVKRIKTYFLFTSFKLILGNLGTCLINPTVQPWCQILITLHPNIIIIAIKTSAHNNIAAKNTISIKSALNWHFLSTQGFLQL